MTYGRENLDATFNTADGVYIVNPEQRIVYWNKGAERILGYSEKDVLNHDCFRIIAGREHSDKLCCRKNCKVHSCFGNGTPVENFDLRTRAKNGDERWLNVSAIFSKNNSDAVIVHVIRDVTREKRIGKATDQFLAAIGATDRGGAKLGSATISLNQPAEKHIPIEESPSLSKRETEVLTLMAEGLSTKAIAEQLNISPFTVRNHIQNILEKLDFHSKSQAVSYAFKNGLL